MVSQRISLLPAGTLPSFQAFCEGIPSFNHNSVTRPPGESDHHCHEQASIKSLPLTPTNSIALFSYSYVCPSSHCNVEAQGFTRWEDCANHMRDRHPELINEFLCRGSIPQAGIFNCVLAPLKRSTHTSPRPRRDSSEHTLDAVSRHTAVGWFDPTAGHAKATLKFVENLTVDELYSALFEVDPSRPLYGDQQASRRPTTAGTSALDEHHGLTYKQRRSKPSHGENERARRGNHSVLVAYLHKNTPEVAHQLAERDTQMLEWKKAGSKGPGKYDQLVSDVYTHMLSAIVAQGRAQCQVSGRATCRGARIAAQPAKPESQSR